MSNLRSTGRTPAPAYTTNGCPRATANDLTHPYLKTSASSLVLTRPHSSSLVLTPPLGALTFSPPHASCLHPSSVPSLFFPSLPLFPSSLHAISPSSPRSSQHLLLHHPIILFPLSSSILHPLRVHSSALRSRFPGTPRTPSQRIYKPPPRYNSAATRSSSARSCCSKNSGLALRMKAITSARPSLNLAKSSL